MEPLNNGHIGDKHFVHCSEVVPSSDSIRARGEQCVYCREVVHSTECPLSEVPLYKTCVCPQVVKALEFLSSHKYVHRDIAARNCLGQLLAIIT